MHNKTYLLFTLILLVGALGQLQSTFTTTQKGDGTYYGGTTGGNCGYGTSIPSWASSVTLVAMNQNQYVGNGQSQGCGMCVSMQGTGVGSGANPVSKTPFTAFVTDRCPECATGSIDIGKSGDGRWGIQWKAVRCPVGSSTLQYKFQGSNSWYLKVQVVGHSLPISNVNFVIGGKYYSASRTQDNFWNAPSSMPQPYSFPLTVQIISLDGQKLTDTIPSLTNDVLLQGGNKVQFGAYGGTSNLEEDSWENLNSSIKEHVDSSSPANQNLSLLIPLGLLAGLVVFGVIIAVIVLSRKGQIEHV